MSDLTHEAVKLVKAEPGAVLLRRQFDEALHGSRSQVTRVIAKLTGEGLLIRIGHGLYAKARRSPLSGKVIPVRSLPELAEESLTLLNIPVGPSAADRAYSEGRSQQVPTGRTIAVGKPTRRRIGFNGAFMRFERAA